MTALLDTCAVLWAARQPERLSARVRALLLDAGAELTVSVVSAWEIALKPELGIQDTARWFREAARHLQARILPVRLEHIAALIAQAVAGHLALVTSDQAIAKYSEAACIW